MALEKYYDFSTGEWKFAPAKTYNYATGQWEGGIPASAADPGAATPQISRAVDLAAQQYQAKLAADAAAAKAASDAAAAKQEADKLNLPEGFKKVNGVWVKDNQAYIDAQNKINQYGNDFAKLQGEINKLDSENWNYQHAWDGGTLNAPKIKTNEERVQVLRGMIDKLNASNEALKISLQNGEIPQYLDPTGQEIFDLEKYTQTADPNTGLPKGYDPATKTISKIDYFGAKTPDEWLNEIEKQLMPTYSEKIKNEIGPEVMKNFSASLERPYNQGIKTILENAASRGTSTSGLTGEALAEALAAKNTAIQGKQQSIADELQSFLDSLATSGYNTAVKGVSQQIMDEFKKSGQSWDDYYRTNQTAINNRLNESAAQSGIDFEKLQADNLYNDQNYLDSINAIGGLFGSVGQLGGSLAYDFNNKNKTKTDNVPLTQAVMPSYGTNNMYNTATQQLSTNPKTGNTYSTDLYSENKNWLGY